MRADHERLWFGPGGSDSCFLNLVLSAIGLPVFCALCVLGYIGLVETSWPALAGAALMAVILALLSVVYIVLELGNWKRMNQRVARQQPRWWWKWWQRPSHPSPTTDQGVENQFWLGLGCVLLVGTVCVVCGCDPVVLVLLSAYL